MRSFLKRHKDQINYSTKKALEIHKAAKHQIELVLSHFRNVYHAEVLAMIQVQRKRDNQLPAGYYRFENVIQNRESRINFSLFQKSENNLIV